MSLFEEQNTDIHNYANNSWIQFLKYVAVCGVLSMFLSALSMPPETKENIIRMAVYVVFVGFAIMIIPLLIGLVSGFLKGSKSFAFLFSWVLIAGLWIIGSLAR